ncbi:MAG: AI-2E family transporter [Christensenellales bacterium]
MDQGKKTKYARPAIITAGLFLVLWLLRAALYAVLAPVFIALIIALVLSPLVRKFEKKMPRGLSVAAAYALLLLILGTILFFAIPPFFDWIRDIKEELPSVIETAKGRLMQLQQQIAAYGIPNELGTQLNSQIAALADNFTGMLINAAGFVSGVITVVATIMIAFYFSVLFLTDREKLSGHMLFMLPQKYHKLAYKTWAEMKHALKRFLFAQGIIAFLSFAGTLPWYYIIGISYPLSLGVFMGICSLIPYIGPVIGAVPAVIVALMEGKLLWTVIAIFVVQQILAVVGPGILGDTLEIHPVYIILAILAIGSLLGFAGMLFAIPISLIIKTAVRNVYREIVQRKYAKTFE